jgi:hypothetical protein
MLCKIWGFHGDGYEECGLLGYKNPVHTSQEKYYVSGTEPSRLMLSDLRFPRRWLWKMPSSGMLRSVALVRTDISEERQFLQESQGVTSHKTAFLWTELFIIIRKCFFPFKYKWMWTFIHIVYRYSYDSCYATFLVGRVMNTHAKYTQSRLWSQDS